MRLAAIEAGGTKFVCASLDGALNILLRSVIPTGAPGETLSAVKDFFAEGGAPHDALGIATFGPAGTVPGEPGHGRILRTPKPGWSGTDMLGALSGIAPAAGFDTDVNGAALAEAALGGQGEPLAYVTVGTGVGVGVAAQGRVLSGTGHYEGGHLAVSRGAEDRWPGHCVFHGDCAEGLASGPAIAARWGSSLSELPDDHEAHGLVAAYLGQFAATLCLLHRPRRIVMGGGVMNTPGLRERVGLAMEERLAGYLDPPSDAARIADIVVAPALGGDAGLLGAALLAKGALT